MWNTRTSRRIGAFLFTATFLLFSLARIPRGVAGATVATSTPTATLTPTITPTTSSLPAPNATLSGATLSWGQVSGATGYQLQWRRTDSSAWEGIVNLPASQLSYDGQQEGFTRYQGQQRSASGTVEYVVQVRAILGDLYTQWSGEFQVPVPVPEPYTRTPSSTPTPSPTPSPTSLYLPTPENLHIRNETQLCWDFDIDAQYYDYFPKDVVGPSGVRGMPDLESVKTQCHAWITVGPDVEELCISVSDRVRSSPWACQPIDSLPTTIPIEQVSILPPSVRISASHGDDTTFLCWDKIVNLFYRGYINTYGSPISESWGGPDYRETEDCWAFVDAEPGEKLCVYMDLLGEVVAVCQTKPFPPRPTPVLPPCSAEQSTGGSTDSASQRNCGPTPTPQARLDTPSGLRLTGSTLTPTRPAVRSSSAP